MPLRADIAKAATSVFGLQTIVPFLLGAVCVAVIGNAAYDLIISATGSSRWALGSVFVVTLAVLLAMVGVLAVVFARARARPPSPVRVPLRKRRGIIVLVSPRPDVARQAIRAHMPDVQRCWLICSADSRGAAETLKQEFGAALIVEQIRVVGDVHDPREYFDHVARIYAEERSSSWTDDDIIADYTGLTASGSLGMALACLSPTRPLQYTPPASVDAVFRGTKPGDPIEIVLAWPPLLARIDAAARSAGDAGRTSDASA